METEGTVENTLSTDIVTCPSSPMHEEPTRFKLPSRAMSILEKIAAPMAKPLSNEHDSQTAFMNIPVTQLTEESTKPKPLKEDTKYENKNIRTGLIRGVPTRFDTSNHTLYFDNVGIRLDAVQVYRSWQGESGNQYTMATGYPNFNEPSLKNNVLPLCKWSHNKNGDIIPNYSFFDNDVTRALIEAFIKSRGKLIDNPDIVLAQEVYTSVYDQTQRALLEAETTVSRYGNYLTNMDYYVVENNSSKRLNDAVNYLKQNGYEVSPPLHVTPTASGQNSPKTL